VRADEEFLTPPNFGAMSPRWWFLILVAISALLLTVTFFSYAVPGPAMLSRVLFWVGLGGENNIGAWWSGMLLALAAFFSFDGFFNPDKPLGERRGWLALGLALLLLSFDEIASLHESLSRLSLSALAVLGVVGLALAGYGMVQLHRAKVTRRVLIRLVFAFGLLATVPLHEAVQKMLEWPDPVVYGIRAVLEEGTEITAMLIFIAAMRSNSVSLLRASRDFLVAPVRRRRLVALSAALLWAPLTAATFVLRDPGGPADWLAALLLLLCALLATRGAVLHGTTDARSVSLILFYVAASAAANAISFEWTPALFGVAVSVRGASFAILVVAAVLLLRANQRRVNLARASLSAAVIAGSALVWPESQLLWCGLPPAFALWLYVLESKAATAQGSAARGSTAAEAVCVTPLEIPVVSS
jgi:hypothetical protein